jgi:primosomal protein N' (replication factor Y)
LEDVIVAKVAVAAAKYQIDKPYDYRIPEDMRDTAVRGLRVTVPFGAGNRTSEGIILALSTESSSRSLKCVLSALEESPAINEEQLKLAIWMSERFFCTVYDAIHACLPSGLRFREGKAQQGEKTAQYISLTMPPEDAKLLAERRRLKASTQSAILALLAEAGEMERGELMYRTGAIAGVFRAMEKRGEIIVTTREIRRAPAVRIVESAEITLSPEQQLAHDALIPLLESDKPEAALLYGVTGSGKTSVYIKLIERALEKNRTAIVLVPEIALTPQLMSIFISRFGDDVAVLHSALTPGERFDEWRRIRTGQVRVAVGTRSAVFAPLENLGLVIIDEEQEHTYKSESAPRYHAREVAKYRAAKSNALLLLGSATPSMESMYKAVTGVYKLVRIDRRYNDRDLPRVILADMKDELMSGNGGAIGAVLERELRENISRGEQSILFINRRGASPIVACPECGHTFECPHCSVSLTYHSANGRLMCHYCGYSEQLPEQCPECAGRLKFIGAGTQKVEAELREKLPEAGILRMDADTISAANNHEKVLSEFRERRVPILLGTQMVAKGLDFENVTLVGVISADQSLYVSDYRAHERTFSLITQVVGRSGRGDKPGRAVIQTMTPEHNVIQLASRQDYDSFYALEIERRRDSGVPPARDMMTITATGEDETAVIAGCARLHTALTAYLKNAENVSILGPAPAPIAKVNNRYRFRITILGKNDRDIRAVVAHTVRQFARDGKNRGILAFADVDPYE